MLGDGGRCPKCSVPYPTEAQWKASVAASALASAQPAEQARANTLSPQRRSGGGLKVVICALALLVLGATLWHRHRQEADQEALRAVDALMVRWDDATKIARATSRVALATPVAVMQGLRREAQELNMPQCLSDIKPTLLVAMGGAVDGFVAFMQNTGDQGTLLSLAEFEKANTALERFATARRACKS